VVVSGEPGIGKTALLGEALSRADARGCNIVSGRAAEFERDLPLAVFADALASVEPDRLTTLVGGELPLLRRVLPMLGLSAEAAGEAGSDERHRLLRILHALLEALATERPLVIALDDLHWADAASVDLVCRLLHRGMAEPSLLLLAARPAQTEPRLRTAFEDAERHGHVRRMELAPLSSDEAAELLRDLPDEALRETVYRESGGNPFYLEQLAAAALRGETPETDGEGAPVPGVPASVRAAIRSELGSLSAPALSLLRAAAALGDPFEADVASEVAELAEADALSALDELLESDLARPADTPGRFRFRHPIVRRGVYESAGAGWLLGAHRRAASALGARGASASTRAPHVERSAQTGDEEAIDLLVRAGQETLRHAPASAAHWFDAALRLARQDEASLEFRLGLLAQGAAALGVTGRIQESGEALREFLRLAPKAPSALRLHAAVLSAILDELLGAHDRGRALLLDELARLPDQSAPEAAELEREIAFTHVLDADWAATTDWARRALAAESRGMVRVGALAALALGEFGLANVEEVECAVAEGAELFDALPDEQVAAHHPGIAMWLGWAEVCAERFEEAIRHLDRGIAGSRQAGQRHLTIGLLMVQGQALALAGRGEELGAVAEAATEAALLTASELFLSWAMTLRSQASLQRGDLHEALRAGERAVGAAAAAASPLSGIARMQLAATLLEAGEPERCREQLTDADGRAAPPPLPLFEAFCFELLVRAELALGASDRARELVGRAGASADRLRRLLPRAHAERARAALLLEGGEFVAAAAAARSAAEAAQAARAPVDAARANLLRGRALTASGQRDEAVVALEAAHAEVVACGAVRYADEAASELRKLGRVVSRPGGRGPDADVGALGLTQREIEVMALVAAGKTNRQIADELFLSVRTVDRHVSRIFAKLGVHSRAAAASVFERARSQAR